MTHGRVHDYRKNIISSKTSANITIVTLKVHNMKVKVHNMKEKDLICSENLFSMAQCTKTEGRNMFKDGYHCVALIGYVLRGVV